MKTIRKTGAVLAAVAILSALFVAQPARVARAEVTPASVQVPIEWKFQADGEAYPMPVRTQAAQQRTVSTVRWQITFSGGSNVFTYAGGSYTLSVTVTVTDPANNNQPVAGARVYDSRSGASATTNASGVATLAVYTSYSRASRLEVSTSTGTVMGHSWWAVINPATDAIVEMSGTDKTGAPLTGRDVQYTAASVNRAAWASGTGNVAAYWHVLPSGTATRFLITGSNGSTADMYAMYTEITPGSYSTAGINRVTLNGQNTVTTQVTAALDGARTRAFVSVAPTNDSYGYVIRALGAETSPTAPGKLHVTPGAYKLRYFLPDAPAIFYEDRELNATTPTVNGQFTTVGQGRMDLSLSKTNAPVDWSSFQVERSKIGTYVGQGSYLATPGTFAIPSASFDLSAGGGSTWYYNYRMNGPRSNLSISAGGSAALNVPAEVVIESTPKSATPGSEIYHSFTVKNESGDLLSMVMDPSFRVPEADLAFTAEDGSFRGSSRTSYSGVGWMVPTEPAQQVYLYQGVFNMGPATPYAEASGVVVVGSAAVAEATPKLVTWRQPSDVIVTVPGAGAGRQVQIGGMGPLTTDAAGRVTFTGLILSKATPIFVDGLRKGIVQMAGIRPAVVKVRTPAFVAPGAAFDAKISVERADGLYAAQVDLSAKTNVAKVTGSDLGTLWTGRFPFQRSYYTQDQLRTGTVVTLVGDVPSVGNTGPLMTVRMQNVTTSSDYFPDPIMSTVIKLSDRNGEPIPTVVVRELAVARIQGTVSNGLRPMNDTIVELINAVTKKRVHYTYTAPDGSFTLAAPVDGEYMVVAREPGYLTATQSVSVTDLVPSLATLPVTMFFGDADGNGTISKDDLTVFSGRYGQAMAAGDPIDIARETTAGVFDLYDIYHAAKNIGRTVPAVLTSRISGVVRTTEQTTIPGATVKAYGQDGVRAAVATTAADGSFEFSVPTGDWRIVVSASGRETVEARVWVAPSSPLALTAELPAPAVMLDTPIGINLTWGATLKDFDSWLEVPGGVKIGTQSSGVVDLWNQGTADFWPWAVHHGDDTSLGGSEQITISKLMPGTYTYWAKKYGEQTANTMQATVSVSGGGLTAQTFSLSNAIGTTGYWKVFTITVNQSGQATVTPVNQIMTQAGTLEVRPAKH